MIVNFIYNKFDKDNNDFSNRHMEYTNAVKFAISSNSYQAI